MRPLTFNLDPADHVRRGDEWVCDQPILGPLANK